MPAKGNAKWTGDLKGGSGTFTAGDSLSGDYSYKSRFEDGPGANPEQLIAAAHASCFSMALTLILGNAGHEPESVETDAKVYLRKQGEGFEIHKIELSTVGTVPGIEESEFVEHAETAKAVCPISKALAGVGEIALEARLSD